MPKSLDDVIQACRDKYELAAEGKVREKYIHFLERQLQAHPEYDINKKSGELDFGLEGESKPHSDSGNNYFPYFNLMLNKLLLFSYLAGDTPIIAGQEGDTRKERISSAKDLYLLKGRELGASDAKKNRTDSRLFRLYGRINNKSNYYGFPDWGDCIDELGRDREVVIHFGQRIDYNMVKECHSRKAVAKRHGGDRRSKKEHVLQRLRPKSFS